MSRDHERVVRPRPEFEKRIRFLMEEVREEQRDKARQAAQRAARKAQRLAKLGTVRRHKKHAVPYAWGCWSKWPNRSAIIAARKALVAGRTISGQKLRYVVSFFNLPLTVPEKPQAWNKTKTTCIRGHSLTDPRNVRITKLAHGRWTSRQCVVCERAKKRERWARQRAKQQALIPKGSTPLREGCKKRERLLKERWGPSGRSPEHQALRVVIAKRTRHWNRNKPRCIRGHRFTAENTRTCRVFKNGKWRIQRSCKACAKLREIKKQRAQTTLAGLRQAMLDAHPDRHPYIEGSRISRVVHMKRVHDRFIAAKAQYEEAKHQAMPVAERMANARASKARPRDGFDQWVYDAVCKAPGITTPRITLIWRLAQNTVGGQYTDETQARTAVRQALGRLARLRLIVPKRVRTARHALLWYPRSDERGV